LWCHPLALRPPAPLSSPPCPAASPRVHRQLPPFPTRRSSDLAAHRIGRAHRGRLDPDQHLAGTDLRIGQIHDFKNFWFTRGIKRSEEHTSELQSRFDLVCRLLLEKKKATSAESSPALTSIGGI